MPIDEKDNVAARASEDGDNERQAGVEAIAATQGKVKTWIRVSLFFVLTDIWCAPSLPIATMWFVGDIMKFTSDVRTLHKDTTFMERGAVIFRARGVARAQGFFLPPPHTLASTSCCLYQNLLQQLLSSLRCLRHIGDALSLSACVCECP